MATKNNNSETLNLYNQGVQLGQQASRLSGVPFTPQTLDAGAMSDVQPFNLKPRATSTGAEGLGAEVTTLSGLDAKQQEIEKSNELALKSSSKEKGKISSLLSNFMSNRSGETALTDSAYNEGGVDTAKGALTDVNNRITAIDVKAQEAIKKLERAGGGLVSGQNVEIDRITRAAATDKADLYLEKLVAQGDYDLAKEIADRKVAMQLEEDQLNYESLKFAYEENKEQFNKAEQRDYEFKLDQYKTELDAQKEEKKAINDLAINATQNGAPTGIVQRALKAETQAEALGILGGYIDAIDRQSKLVDIAYKQALITEKKNDLASGTLTDVELKNIDASPQGKKLTTLADLKSKANNYQTLVEEYGLQQTGQGRTLLENAYADLQVAWKEAANLGALTGPDLQLIQDSVKPATGLRAIQTQATGGGSAGILNGLKQMTERIDRDAASSYSLLLNRNQKYEDSGYVQGLGAPFLEQYRTQLNDGEILVRDISTGEVGAIPEQEFKSTKYQKL